MSDIIERLNDIAKTPFPSMNIGLGTVFTISEAATLISDLRAALAKAEAERDELLNITDSYKFSIDAQREAATKTVARADRAEAMCAELAKVIMDNWVESHWRPVNSKEAGEVRAALASFKEVAR